MNPLLAPEVQKKSVFRITLFIILTVALLGSGAFALQKYFEDGKKPVLVYNGGDNGGNKGLLYYTATRVGEDKSNLFELNLQTKQSKLLRNTEGTYQITRVQKGIEATSYTNQKGKSVIELIATDANGVKETSYVESPVAGGRIGKIAWNDIRTVLLYETISATGAPDVKNTVSIYSYNVTKKINTLLTAGHNPTFYNDKTFLFLKDDGVYVFDVTKHAATSSTQAKLVSTFDGFKAMDNSSMLFSPDKKTLLVTHPHVLQVELYTVVPSESTAVALSRQGKRSESMISPVASPDGRLVAFFEAGVATSSREMMVSTVDRKTGKKVNEYAVMLDSTKPFVISFWK